MKIWDISLPIADGMIVYPGDPRVSVKAKRSSSGASISTISMGSHTGTHIDPPSHMLPEGKDLDSIPLEVLMGPVKVLDLTAVSGGIGAAQLGEFDIAAGDRLLLKTKNSALWGRETFSREFVFLSESGAKYASDKKVGLVGIDYLSVEEFGTRGHSAHLTLIRSNIIILEGLNLGDVEAGDYFLICLPLKISGGDGGPARAVLLEALNP